ncbi:MAG: hypothetical protein IJZ68_07550 [Bacteroidaceae bacterium]|nr:hypothetical protein [Bacteroidaceae bacterium]
MILIFTLDDDNGTQLAGKRQSRDRVVGDKIIALANGNLHMLQKTTSFFKNNDMTDVPCTVFSDMWRIPENAVFFTEDVLPAEIMESAEKIYVFRWNRRYPSLVKDRVNLDGYTKTVIEEFPGHSHDKITLEVYTK